MRPLNRPMFRYGGPIKEGIMTGMKSKPALVGNPVYPKGPDGRSEYGYGTALNFLTKTGPFLRNIYQGMKIPSGSFQAPSTGIFSGPVMSRIRSMFPSGRFRQTSEPFTKIDKTTGKVIEGSKAKQLGLLESFKDPKRIGMAIRENPFTTAYLPSTLYSAGSTGFPIAKEAFKGAVNMLVPGTRFDPFGPKKDDIKTTGEGEIKRGGKTTNVGEVGTGGTGDSKSDAEKKQINEARIEENKQKYYKLMGIDKMNKEATYDSLIDASKIIAEKGGDLKGAIKSGDLQSSLISAISKNLDKSTDLKKQIDAAVLKAEIQKDINLTKPSAFAEQVAYLRNNPNDPLARKLSGLTSVADNLAAVKTAELTSDLVQRLVESKGTDVAGTVQDDKYQKWEKNNEGKDEIDYIQENLKGIEPGVYIINKRAIQIKDGVATEIDLDSIVG